MLDNLNSSLSKTSLSVNNSAKLLLGLLTLLVLSSCASGGGSGDSTKQQSSANSNNGASGNWPQASVNAFARGVSALGKDNENARVAFAEAIELSPTMEAAYYNLAKLDLDQKNFEAVDSFVVTVQSNNVASARLWNLFATSKRQQADFDTAKSYYLAAIQLDPAYTAALLNIAILHDVYLGDVTTAEKYYLEYQVQLNQQGKEDNRLKNWLLDVQRRLAQKNGSGK